MQSQLFLSAMLKILSATFHFSPAEKIFCTLIPSLLTTEIFFLNTGGNAGVNFYVGKSHYSTDTWCISTKNLSDYLYLLLKIIEPELNKKFFQGTGLKHLQKDLLKKFAIYIPTNQEREHFNKFVCPLFDTISKNQRENYLLENLRDFLLPLLMNGQVTFTEED